MTPGPVSVEEYERTHHTPAQDDTVLYATERRTYTMDEIAHVWVYSP
jgi:uncharacterized FAD-dependent dehydrogenase